MDNKPILVFDVNETLLDMAPIAQVLENIFKDKHAMRLWFDQLLIYSDTFSLTHEYLPFSEMGVACLKMVADIYEVELTEKNIADWAQAFAKMPPYAEVGQALARLQQAGFTLVTLTNNPVNVQTAQLISGQIDQYFDQKYSTDAVKSIKPDLITYRYVENELNAEPQALMMIACHIWDIIGAGKSDWQTTFIKRPENALLPVGIQPDFIFENLDDFATAMIKKYDN
ncbi:MAG: haloacid dehalogenase type II [Lactococcus sp.]